MNITGDMNMNEHEIRSLLKKFDEGETSLAEEEMLRTFFTSDGEIPEQWSFYRDYFKGSSEVTAVTSNIDAFEKIEANKKGSVLSLWSREWIKAAAVVLFILSSFSLGFAVGNSSGSETQLSAEIDQIKTLLISGAYKQASASDRIMAVKRSGEFRSSDDQIGTILIYVLNNDDNINVRIEAAKALSGFAENEMIQKALVHSLGNQNEPLVQMTLLEIITNNNIKRAIPEIRKLQLDSTVDESIKPKLEAALTILSEQI